MSDFDRFVADRMLVYYATGLDGLTFDECECISSESLFGGPDEYLLPSDCSMIGDMIGGKRPLVVDDTAAQAIQRMGFSADFIDQLKGVDGRKPLDIRVAWLSEYVEENLPTMTCGGNPRSALCGHCNTKYTESAEDLAEAMRQLGEMGPDAAGSLPSLLEAAKSPEWKVRDAAATAMKSIDCGGAKDLIIAALDGADARSKESLMWSLHHLLRGTDAIASEEVIGAYISMLGDEEPRVKMQAAQVLLNIGTGAAAAAPALKANARHDDPYVRGATLWALGAVVPGDMEARGLIVDGLKDRERHVRQDAAIALGYADKSAIPHMLKAAEDRDANVAAAGISSLGYLGWQASGTAPVVMKYLDDSSATVRAAAAGTCGFIGASKAYDRIAALFSDVDENWNVRLQSAEAMIILDPKTAVPTLFAYMEAKGDEDTVKIVGSAIRQACSYLSPVMDAFAMDIFAALAAQLAGEPGRDNEMILEGFRAMEPESSEPFIDALKSKDWRMQLAAIYMIAEKEFLDARPALGEAMGDDDEMIRNSAFVALERFSDIETQ